MEKDKQLMLLQGEQALVRVGVQMGLVNKVLEEDEQERKNAWTLILNKLFEAQFFEDLLNKSEQCVLEFPNWYFGYFCRGNAKYNLYNVEDLKAAILDYDKAIRLDPYEAKIYMHRYEAKLAIGDTEGYEKDSYILGEFSDIPICNSKEEKVGYYNLIFQNLKLQ